MWRLLTNDHDVVVSCTCVVGGGGANEDKLRASRHRRFRETQNLGELRGVFSDACGAEVEVVPEKTRDTRSLLKLRAA